VIADSASFPAIPELGITTLEYDSPGKASIAAGVKKGDVLLAVDQEPVHSRADEARIFLRHKPGDAVILTLQRAKSSPLTASMWLSTFFREPVGVRSS
jgi:S1-C subfamily serine protease